MAYLLDDQGTPAVAIPPLPDGCSLYFDPTVRFYPATGAPSGRRHYLVPGLYGDINQWDTAPFNSFADLWRSQGDELVSLDHPVAAACFFTNGGWQYRDQFNQALHAAMDAIEATHGAARINIAGGMSYGGLHAMLAAVCNDRIAYWWAHLPVTRIDALLEFASVGSVVKFNPQYELAALALKPGWLGWGTADTRVNGALTAGMVPSLPLVSAHAYNVAHDATMPAATDIAVWCLGV